MYIERIKQRGFLENVEKRRKTEKNEEKMREREEQTFATTKNPGKWAKIAVYEHFLFSRRLL
jgi:hypothetical protein